MKFGHLTLDPAQNRQAEGKGAIETQLGPNGLLGLTAGTGQERKTSRVFFAISGRRSQWL